MTPLALPRGWYVVAFSSELAPRALRRLTFAGEPVVLWRTAAGKAALLPAYCPHLGADLGVGGRVEGETLRCPMHAFRFDTGGRCVATGYGTKPPPRAQTAGYPVLEQDGLVMAWVDPAGGAAPCWTPPRLLARGLGPLRTHCFAGLTTHPQETTENSVDLGHLAVVHGYRSVEITEALRLDGPNLFIGYRLGRRPFLPGTGAITIAFSIQVYGLGYSVVDVDVVSHGFATRHFILPTPTSAGRIDLRIAACLAPTSGLTRRLPRALFDVVLGSLLMRAFKQDVGQDVPLWGHKIHLEQPALAAGDGPIGRYRQWARQFY